MDSNYTIGVYLRISKEDEGEESESNSIGNQRELIRDFLKRKKEFGFCKVLEFIDDGYSGTNFCRPGIESLLEKIKTKQIHCIIVKDFSRFGRNYIEAGDYLEQIFPFLGVRFISINDEYDSSEADKTNKTLDIAIKNLIYDLYSKDLSKKITSALEIKKTKGEFLGTSAPYGYKKDKKNKNFLIIDDEAAKIVKKIYTYTIEGKKRTEISRELNRECIDTPGVYLRKSNNNNLWGNSEGKSMWTAQTIVRILRNPVYIGCIVNNKGKTKEIGSNNRIKNSETDWKISKEVHKSIITEKEFYLAQETFQKHKETKLSSTKEYYLKGILCCGYCRHLLERKKEIYFCHYKRFVDLNNCGHVIVEEKIILEAMFHIVKNYALLTSGIIESNRVVASNNIIKNDNKSQKKRLIKRSNIAYLDNYENFKKGKISLEKYKLRKNEIGNLLVKLNETKEIESVSRIVEKNKERILQEMVSTVWVYSPDRIEIAFLT